MTSSRVAPDRSVTVRAIRFPALLPFLLFTLLSSSLACAAPAFVQSNYSTPQSAVASVTTTYSGAQTAGNLNVVVVGINDGTTPIQSVSDLRGNVYQLAVGPAVYSGRESQAIYYAANIVGSSAGSNKVTVTFGAAAVHPDVRIAEYSGIDAANPIDVVKSDMGNSTLASTGSVTTTNANDLIVAASMVATATTAAGAGYTNRVITMPDRDILEDRVVSALGSFSATAPVSPAGVWIMQLVAFRAATASGGSGPPPDQLAPSAPTGFIARASASNQIDLSWTAATDNVAVAGYAIDRCQGASCSGFARIATTSRTSYTDSGLAASTTYQYRISAYDAAGNTSGFATASSSTPQAVANTGPVPVQYVQGNYATPQTPQSTVSVTFNGAQTSGNLNVVAIGWDDSSSAVASVADQRGNTYLLGVGPTVIPNVKTQAIYYAANIAGSAAGTNRVTVTFSGSAKYPDVRLAEYSGIDTANPVDSGAEGSGNSGLSSSGPMTTHSANTLLVSANTVLTTTTAAGSGWTRRYITSPNADILQDRVVTSAGSYTATAPLSPASSWIMQALAFRVASVTGGEAAQTVPAAPRSVSATAGDAAITVSWTAPNDGGSPISGYTLTANPGGITRTVGTGSTSATLTGLTNGTSYTVSVFATNAVGNGAAANSNAVTPMAAGTSAFPLVHSSNQRYLQDQRGVPFPILGRTAWFVTSLSQADYQVFIDDSVSRGYNTVEFHVINHDPRGNRPPFNGAGALPFLKRLDGGTWNGSLSYSNPSSEAPDFTTPNPAFWSFVDAFLQYCESKGVLVMMFPAYVGFQGGNQGWMQEVNANGSSRMNTYGAWIANRYANQKNIVWMAGGDMATFTSSQASAESGLLNGLRSVAGKDYSAEWDSNMIATDQSQFGSLMTLNGVYSWQGDVNTQGRRAYARSPTIPSFLLEEPYDQEGPDGNSVNPNATQPVRRFQWWGWLSSIGGYVSGNGYVWPFRSGWQSHLDTQGSRDMARLNAFIKSVSWSQLVPSGMAGMKTIVTNNGSPSAGDYVAAAATPSGTLIVAYVPPGRSGNITIDMSVMSGTSRARWYNPTTGTSSSIGVFGNSGAQSFAQPGNNGTGQTDWVLVVEKQ